MLKDEYLYRSLFEQSHDAVFILDLEGRHLRVNRRAAAMLGYTVEEIRGLSFKDLSAQVDESIKVRERILAGEQIPLFERLFRKKSGEIIPVEINIELVRDGDGTPLYIQSMVRDISHRKAMEAALQQSEMRYRSVVGGISEGVIVVNNQGLIETCNQAAEQILGVKAEHLIGTPSTDRRWKTMTVDGVFLREAEHPTAITLRTGKSQTNVVLGITRSDDRLVWISTNTVPLIREGEQQPYAVVATFTDITERRNTEIALRDSEARLRRFMEFSSDGIIFVGAHGEILEWNPAQEHLTGLSLADVKGRFIWDVEEQLAPPGTQPRIMSDDQKTFMLRILTTEGLVWQSSERELYVQNARDQSIHTLQTMMFTIPRPTGNLLAAVCRDITSRKQAEQALKQSEERFSQTFHNTLVPMVISTTDVKAPRYVEANEAYLGCVRKVG